MKNYFLILIYSLTISCNFNKTYENQESDKKDAEKITNKFYFLIKENKKNEIFNLLGSKFFEVSDIKELNKTIDWTNNEAGNMSSYLLSEWETTILKGTNPEANYLLVYEVKRGKINTQEIFFLEKQGTEIKITGYKVNLDIPNK